MSSGRGVRVRAVAALVRLAMTVHKSGGGRPAHIRPARLVDRGGTSCILTCSSCYARCIARSKQRAILELGRLELALSPIDTTQDTVWVKDVCARRPRLGLAGYRRGLTLVQPGRLQLKPQHDVAYKCVGLNALRCTAGTRRGTGRGACSEGQVRTNTKQMGPATARFGLQTAVDRCVLSQHGQP